MEMLLPDNLELSGTGADTIGPLIPIEPRSSDEFEAIEKDTPTGATTFKIHFVLTQTDMVISADDLTPPAILKSDIVKTMFELLAPKWKSETANQSSIRRLKDNANYQRIVELGEDVIPHILEDLVSGDQPAFWFPALKDIAGGEDPVSPEHRGNVPEMTRAWIRWDQERRLHRYVWFTQSS